MVDHDEQFDRTVKLEQISRLLDAQASNEHVAVCPSDEQLMAAHPELMPELAEELAKRRLIRGAAQQAAASSVPPGVGSTRDGALHVRCPHCQSPIELVADVPWEELICPSCGSTFNLLGVKETKIFDHADTKTLGHFELIDRVGMGAFGTVWMARDLELDRTVALKIPRKGQLSRAELEQFMREARAAAQLRHPHIVSVHEVGRQDDTVYIVSDFIHGATLADWLTGQRLAPREAAELCIKLAEALHHAHELGVVHRDLKPSNIMLDRDGEPHLMDFGLAKREAGEITMTLAGDPLGTPAYMSPEQARGDAHQADGRSDIYSLGVILFELLTNELPFRGKPRMLIWQIQNEEPPSPRKLNSTVPRDLETICLKCLEKDAKKRYQSAAELSADLKRFVHGKPINARPVGRVERTWRWCKRQPVVAGLAAAVLVTLIMGAALSSYFAWNEFAQRERAEGLAGERGRLAAELTSTLQKQDLQLSQFYFERGWSQHLQGNSIGGLLNLEASLGIVDRMLTLAPLGAELNAELLHRHHSLRSLLTEFALSESCPRTSLPLDGVGGAIVFSPDGARLATASGNTVRLWDVATGKPFTEPLQHDGRVSQAIFSPDGIRLATASEKSIVRHWDLTTGKLLSEPRRLDGRDARFSPDGLRLVTLSDGNTTLQLYDVATCKPLATLSHENTLRSFVFSPDGMRLATVSDADTVQFWDVATGKPISAPLQHEQVSVFSLTISPDGMQLATLCGNVVQLWDVATGKLRESLLHERFVRQIDFSPDGKRLATASDDGTARLWDARTGKPLGEPLRQDGSVSHVTFSPDGTLLASASHQTTRIWDVVTGKLIGKARQHGSAIDYLTFSSDGRWLATASRDSARLWELANEKAVGEPYASHADYVAFSPDGTRLATASLWDNTARICELDTRNPLSVRLQHVDAVYQTAFSPDGLKVATVSGADTVQFWDVATGKPLSKVVSDEGVHLRDHVAFSPNWARLATVSKNTARLWDLATCKPLGVLRHDALIHCVIFSPDGTRLATASSDNTARIWDVTSSESLGRPLLHEGLVRHLAFSPDGARLATGSHDNTARLWDVATGKPLVDPLGHATSVFQVCFSPDGARLATASGNSVRLSDAATGKALGEPLFNESELTPPVPFTFTSDGLRLATASGTNVRLWDINSGRPLGAPLRHDYVVSQIVVSPDGARLATVSVDGVARLWDVAREMDETTAQVHLWVQVLTGAEMDDFGEVHAISADLLTNKLQQLEHTGGRPKEYTRILAARRSAIERQQLDFALSLLSADQPFAALWHADARLKRRNPDDPVEQIVKTHALRALSLAELERDQESWDAMQAMEQAAVGSWTASDDEINWRINAYRSLGLQFNTRGHVAQSIACLERMLEYTESLAARSGIAVDYYNAACAQSLLAGVLSATPERAEEVAASKDTAVSTLRRAMLSGAETLEFMRNDTDFDSIRDHPGYVELEKTLERVQQLIDAADYTALAKEFAKLSGQYPADPWLYHLRAMALLGAGDIDGYRTTCTEMMGRVVELPLNEQSVNVLVYAIVAVPTAIDDYDRLIALTQQGHAGERELGAVLFRAGRYTEAMEKFNHQQLDEDLYFMAMIQERLGNHDQAVQFLAQGKAAHNALQDSSEWYTKVVGTALLAEAKALIGVIDEELSRISTKP